MTRKKDAGDATSSSSVPIQRSWLIAPLPAKSRVEKIPLSAVPTITYIGSKSARWRSMYIVVTPMKNGCHTAPKSRKPLTATS